MNNTDSFINNVNPLEMSYNDPIMQTVMFPLLYIQEFGQRFMEKQVQKMKELMQKEFIKDQTKSYKDSFLKFNSFRIKDIPWNVTYWEMDEKGNRRRDWFTPINKQTNNVKKIWKENTK